MSETSRLMAGIEFGESSVSAGGRYAFEVKALPNYGFASCASSVSCGQQGVCGGGSTAPPSKGSRTPRASRQRWKPLPWPCCWSVATSFAPVFELLGSMRAYSIEPARLRELQDPDRGVSLRKDGRNEASVLQDLTARGSEAESMRGDIFAFLEAIVPETRSVRPNEHGNQLSMNSAQQWETDKKLTLDAFSQKADPGRW